LNAINPQVAARLARGLDRWKKFASPFQEMMHSTLAELAQQNLSSDVAEIIHKALSTD
jgi:aminopeptidase N